MKTVYQISKEAALVVAGAFLGILAVPFEIKITGNLILLTIVLGILILYGIGLVEWLAALLLWGEKKLNIKRSSIGIYAPFDVKVGENSTWINVDVQTIANILKDNDIRSKIAKKENIFKKYQIVINPFGGVYPEKDLSQLQSIGAIFDFVLNGGIYINIADIPFYYAFDDVLNRRVDTTPLAGDFTTTRSFFHTLLTRKLHCFVLGLPNGMPGNPEVKRVIQFSSPNGNLFEESFEENGNGAFSPVLKIAYGKGFFIFSTLHINQTNAEKNIMRVVNAAIVL